MWKIISRCTWSPLVEILLWTGRVRQSCADAVRVCGAVLQVFVSLAALWPMPCYQWWFLRGQRRGFVLPRSDVTDPSAEALLQFLQFLKTGPVFCRNSAGLQNHTELREDFTEGRRLNMFANPLMNTLSFWHYHYVIIHPISLPKSHISPLKGI